MVLYFIKAIICFYIAIICIFGGLSLIGGVGVIFWEIIKLYCNIIDYLSKSLPTFTKYLYSRFFTNDTGSSFDIEVMALR